MIKAIKSYLSLKRIRDAFTDKVSGKVVCIYKDCYGNEWLKDSRWSFFKVEKSETHWQTGDKTPQSGFKDSRFLIREYRRRNFRITRYYLKKS